MFDKSAMRLRCANKSVKRLCWSVIVYCCTFKVPRKFLAYIRASFVAKLSQTKHWSYFLVSLSVNFLIILVEKAFKLTWIMSPMRTWETNLSSILLKWDMAAVKVCAEYESQRHRKHYREKSKNTNSGLTVDKKLISFLLVCRGSQNWYSVIWRSSCPLSGQIVNKE